MCRIAEAKKGQFELRRAMDESRTGRVEVGGTFHDVLHTRWIREDLEDVLGGSSRFHPSICGVSGWGS